MLQKFGNVEKFDLLFHRNGPLSGQPRGYAFVTYEKIESSNLARDKLHGQKVGVKNVIVRLAKNFNLDDFDNEKPKPVDIPALAAGSSSNIKPTNMDKKSTIQAIEAKLKSLECRTSSEFELNKTSSHEPPLIQRYQFNKEKKPDTKQVHRSHPYKKYNKRR